MAPVAIGTEYYLFGGAGVVSLLAFGALILVPALGAYGRSWEKATAALLSVFVLIVLVMLGIAIGVLIVYFWPQITEVIPGLD
jgi:O-antigen ligase